MKLSFRKPKYTLKQIEIVFGERVGHQASAFQIADKWDMPLWMVKAITIKLMAINRIEILDGTWNECPHQPQLKHSGLKFWVKKTDKRFAEPKQKKPQTKGQVIAITVGFSFASMVIADTIVFPNSSFLLRFLKLIGDVWSWFQ